MVNESPTPSEPLTDEELQGLLTFGDFRTGAVAEIRELRVEVQRLKMACVGYDAKIVLMLTKNARLREELERYKNPPEAETAEGGFKDCVFSN